MMEEIDSGTRILNIAKVRFLEWRVPMIRLRRYLLLKLKNKWDVEQENGLNL